MPGLKLNNVNKKGPISSFVDNNIHNHGLNINFSVSMVLTPKIET